MSGQRPQSISLAEASDYFFVLVDFRLAKIKGEFRALRSASQGNSAHVLGPWPNKSATALRENAPQGPFLVPQGDRNFIFSVPT